MTRRARGTGTIEHRLRGGVLKFYARLPGVDQIPLKGFFDTYEEADRALDVAIGLVESGVARPRKTLEAFGFDVIDRRELDGYRNTKDERRRWKSYVTPWECAAWPLENVKRKHVNEWIRHLRARGLASQTIANAVNLLRAVYRAAVDDELVEVNPCAELRVKKTGQTRETSTFLSLDELAGLFWSSDDEAKHLIAFAAGTGLRQGEMRSLLADDVKLDDERPHVIVRYGSPGKPTKSGKIRRVPLFGIALAAAKSWQAARAIEGTAVATFARVTRSSTGADEPKRAGFFFATQTGRARQKGHLLDRNAKRWRSWLRAAGIERGVRWHDLRHTCATLLLTGKLSDAPWTLEAVKEMLGHSTIQVTERYAKATGSLAEDAARGPCASSIAAASCELPTFYQLPNADPLSARFWSRLRDLNSRPTVYENVARSSENAVLAHGVGLAVVLLQRAASVGDVSRGVVERALNVLDAADEDARGAAAADERSQA